MIGHTVMHSALLMTHSASFMMHNNAQSITVHHSFDKMKKKFL